MTTTEEITHTDFMLDQIFGMILFGLGLQTPHGSAVLGDTHNDTSQAIHQQIGHNQEIQHNQDLHDAIIHKEANFSHSIDDQRISAHQFEAEIAKHRHEAENAFKSKHDDFEKKLHDLKDEHKKQILDRLDFRINEINTKRTDALTRHLNKINEILDKIADRQAAAKANGRDTSTIESQLAVCRSDVASAQGAISAQAGKQYVITLSSENTAKVDAGATLKQLETDIKSVRDQVVTARKCVADALRDFGQAQREPTPSVNLHSPPAILR